MFLTPPISKTAFRKENFLRALDSQDPVVIKDARKAQRQALTRGYNALQKELDKKDDAGQLDLSLISEDVVKEILVKANEAYRDLVDLHEHYLAKKPVIVNTDEEDGSYPCDRIGNSEYYTSLICAKREGHNENEPRCYFTGHIHT